MSRSVCELVEVSGMSNHCLPAVAPSEFGCFVLTTVTGSLIDMWFEPVVVDVMRHIEPEVSM